MHTGSSFRQILNEKLALHDEETASYQGATKADPAHMAFLIGQIGRFNQVQPKGHYPRPAVRPQRKAHVLNSAEQLSFAFLQQHNAELSAGFTESELKKAFRHSAFVLHPDQGGNAADFCELKAHYEVLKGVIARKA